MKAFKHVKQPIRTKNKVHRELTDWADEQKLQAFSICLQTHSSLSSSFQILVFERLDLLLQASRSSYHSWWHRSLPKRNLRTNKEIQRGITLFNFTRSRNKCCFKISLLFSKNEIEQFQGVEREREREREFGHTLVLDEFFWLSKAWIFSSHELSIYSSGNDILLIVSKIYYFLLLCSH